MLRKCLTLQTTLKITGRIPLFLDKKTKGLADKTNCLQTQRDNVNQHYHMAAFGERAFEDKICSSSLCVSCGSAAWEHYLFFNISCWKYRGCDGRAVFLLPQLLVGRTAVLTTSRTQGRCDVIRTGLSLTAVLIGFNIGLCKGIAGSWSYIAKVSKKVMGFYWYFLTYTRA